MFGFSELCSNVTKLLICGIHSLVHKIRQQNRHRIIERDRRRRYERENLAWIASASIRRALDYQSIGRQLLMVDELPQGAYARYFPAVTNHRYELPDTCSICGGMGDNCSHLNYTEERDRIFDEADRANNAVQLSFDEDLDRDTNSAHREYNC